MSESQTYDFNFFKPSSAYARSNTRLIGAIVIVWALAVFGFHFLMKSIEEQVPEKQLTRFEEIWPNAMGGNASQQELQDLAKIHLNLIGRYYRQVEQNLQ